MARATRESGSSDALTLLKRDHTAVKQLFEEFEDAEEEEEEKQDIADRICRMLTVHAQIEEELFYPAARPLLEDGELIDEAEVEHMTAKALVTTIEAMEAGEPRFDATVKVLGEYVDHHVEEEEGEIFPKLKRTDLDLEALGAKLAARRQELMSEYGLVEEELEELEAGEEDEEEEGSRGTSRKRSQPGSGERRQVRSSGSHRARRSKSR